MSRVPRAFRSIFKLALGAALALGGTGCSTVHYFWQAGKGQMELFNKARPIPEVLKDPSTPDRIRALLVEIGPIKRYGESHGLRATPNYREYVKLDRPAAVWVVSACEPLEFKAREWSFPIVGSFPYLGWFERQDALDYASTLKEQGLDVDVRGAGAYSTLGWFRDPVLSTMLPHGPQALGELANVILHESLHATIYVKGQSYFDESLAVFVAAGLTPGYLEAARPKGSPELSAYLKADENDQRMEDALHAAYEKLDKLYSSRESDTRKREEKAAYLAKLKDELHYRRDINNATLIQYKTYNTGQAQFEALLKACGGDWHRFLKAVGTLRPESFSQPQQEDLAPVFKPLLDAGCPQAQE